MFSQHPSEQNSDPNAPVRQTDTDASLARLSAVQKGYLKDPFVRHFVPRAHLQPPRPPLINVGTYVRAEGIDGLVNGWLGRGKRCQITGPKKDAVVRYVELDFPEVTAKKAMAIRKSRELSMVLGEDMQLTNGGTTLHSPVYHLLPIDLRRPPNESLAPILLPSDASPLLDPSLPTLLLFECVLVYMTPDASSALIRWFVDYFAGKGVLGGIVYEMFGLGDAFGKVMLNNLKSRHVDLPGVDPYPNVSSLPSRFLRHDFTSVYALTLREIRRTIIVSEELERISQLEMLDEVEELELVLEHYAVTWGVKVPETLGDDTRQEWTTWELQKQR